MADTAPAGYSNEAAADEEVSRGNRSAHRLATTAAMSNAMGKWTRAGCTPGAQLGRKGIRGPPG